MPPNVFGVRVKAELCKIQVAPPKTILCAFSEFMAYSNVSLSLAASSQNLPRSFVTGLETHKKPSTLVSLGRLVGHFPFPFQISLFDGQIPS